MTHPDPVQDNTRIPRDPTQPITAAMWTALHTAWPSAQRLTIAWRLAKDLQTLEALLAGEPVDPACVHADEMQRALEPRLVQLVRPIDVLEVQAA